MSIAFVQNQWLVSGEEKIESPRVQPVMAIEDMMRRFPLLYFYHLLKLPEAAVKLPTESRYRNIWKPDDIMSGLFSKVSQCFAEAEV